MPRGDGTGPGGTSITAGRGNGRCAGHRGKNPMKSASGRGAARGLCGWFSATELSGGSARENEEKVLKAQAEALLKRQEEVNRRLSELKK